MPDRQRDHEREEALGMNRQIDRREFINGILIGAGAITASGWLVACTPDGASSAATATAAATGSTSPGGTAAYPPALTGLRGSTQSTASVMHALRDGGTWDASGPPTELDEHYSKTGKTVGPLHGLPISLKDNFNIVGKTSATGFCAWAEEPMQKDSTIVSLLRELGAVAYVKTNVPTAMMIAESVNNCYGR